MTYGEKLKELLEYAVQKLKDLNKIKEDFKDSHKTQKYSDIDLQRADNEHRKAVNDYNNLQQEMKNKGISPEDDYPAV